MHTKIIRETPNRTKIKLKSTSIHQRGSSKLIILSKRRDKEKKALIEIQENEVNKWINISEDKTKALWENINIRGNLNISLSFKRMKDIKKENQKQKLMKSLTSTHKLLGKNILNRAKFRIKLAIKLEFKFKVRKATKFQFAKPKLKKITFFQLRC